MFVSLLMKVYKYHYWTTTLSSIMKWGKFHCFYCFHMENPTHCKKKKQPKPNIPVHKVQKPELILPEFMKLFPSFHSYRIIVLWLELKPRHQASNLHPLKIAVKFWVWISKLTAKHGRIINLSTLDILASSDTEPILNPDVWSRTHTFPLSMHSCI